MAQHQWTSEEARIAGAKGNITNKKKYAELREKFCLEYVSNGYNAQKAYYDVYHTENPISLQSGVNKMMRKPEIKARIDALIKEKYDTLHINAERVAEKLSEIAFSEKEDEIYNTNAKLKALDMLQKQLGLQKQQIKQEVEQVTTINVGIVEDGGNEA